MIAVLIDILEKNSSVKVEPFKYTLEYSPEEEVLEPSIKNANSVLASEETEESLQPLEVQ